MVGEAQTESSVVQAVVARTRTTHGGDNTINRTFLLGLDSVRRVDLCPVSR